MLSPTLSLPRAAMGVAALCFAGCLQPAEVPDADPTPPRDASADAPATPPPDVPVSRCSNGGSGRLRVSVSLSPTLASRTADVWLALQCDADPIPVRLVRWDGSPTQALDGFGPGTWRVFASTFLSPGAWSTTATLEGVSTAAVSLTLQDEGALLAQVGASSTGVPDAGVPDAASDASASDDASVAPGWNARVAMRDTVGGPGLGWVSVTARAVDASSIEVRVVVQSLCTQTPCPPLTLSTVEARTAEGNTPTGFASSRFGTSLLQYGDTTALPTALVLRGALPDAHHSLQVAVFSAHPPTTNAIHRP